MRGFIKSLRAIQQKLFVLDVYQIWASTPKGVSQDQSEVALKYRINCTVLPEKEQEVRTQTDTQKKAFLYHYVIGDQQAGHVYIHPSERYRRATIDLHRGEAKLISVVTESKYRGKGIAPQMIRYATRDMNTRGYHMIYARIWHSNYPSQRAFVKAGWQRIGTVCFIRSFVIPLPFMRKRMLRFSRFWKKATLTTGRIWPRVQFSIRHLRDRF